MEYTSLFDSQSYLQTLMDDEDNTVIIRRTCPSCHNNAKEQLPGNRTLCMQPRECCGTLRVKDFVSLVTQKCLTLKRIELTNVAIFLSPLDRKIYKKLSLIKHFVAPVRLSDLEVLKLSITTNKNKRYKKILKLLLFFIQGKSKLNRLWQDSSKLQTVDLECGNETIIRFVKNARELVVGRFKFISPDEYLRATSENGNGLLKFACFKNRVTWEKMEQHKKTLTELILNHCEIRNEREICTFLPELEKLHTLILDCGNGDFSINIENLFDKAPQLKVLVIGHCEVVFNQGYNAMKNQFNGNHVTFFNCVISAGDLMQNDDEEISIDETGKASEPVKTQWNLKEFLKDPTKYPKEKNDRKYFKLFRMDMFSPYENRYFRFGITSAEKLPSSSSLNPPDSTNPLVSQTTTPSRPNHPIEMIANEHDLIPQPRKSTLPTEQETLLPNPVSPATMVSPTPIYNIATSNNPFNNPNENGLIRPQNPFLPDHADQETLPSNPAVSPTLISTVMQSESFSISIQQSPIVPSSKDHCELDRRETLNLNPAIPLVPEIPLEPSINPYTPSTEQKKLLATKLKHVVNDLDQRNQYKGIPLKEVFQGYFTDLYANTNIPDDLVTLLKDMKVLDDGSARKIMATKETEHTKCCELIYDPLFKNMNADLLIHMWEKTTNAHLIQRTLKWLDVKFPFL